jgi:hypothetical protein
MQFKKAQEGNVPMLIWLGKQYLGQSEKHELSGPAGGPINQEHALNDSAKDKFISATDRLAATARHVASSDPIPH